VKGEKKKKIVRVIKVDADRCNGCLTCEMICSAFHSEPKYSRINPARARIRVIREPITDTFLPVFAGEYTAAECAGREKYKIKGKEYDECQFCKASCPSRGDFHEPDSGIPLKCDRCEGEEVPLCVQWCHVKALTCEDREVEVGEELVEIGQIDVEVGLESMISKYGKQTIIDTITRMSKKD